MPGRTENELRRARHRAHARERRVEDRLKKARNNREHYFDELKEEREERERLRDRRGDIRRLLAIESEKDEYDQGEHPEEWEDRKADRLDELADLIEASNARSDRLAERLLKEKHDIKELLRKDERFERQIERLNGKIKKIQKGDGQLTKDFYLVEFDCREGPKISDGAIPQIVPHIEALCVRHLQPLRNSGGAVHGTSCHRWEFYNRKIGGALGSYHEYEKRLKAPAIDHVQQGRSPAAVRAWHDAHRPFDGQGAYATFTHGDDRGYFSRWTG